MSQKTKTLYFSLFEKMETLSARQLRKLEDIAFERCEQAKKDLRQAQALYHAVRLKRKEAQRVNGKPRSMCLLRVRLTIVKTEEIEAVMRTVEENMTIARPLDSIPDPYQDIIPALDPIPDIYQDMPDLEDF